MALEDMLKGKLLDALGPMAVMAAKQLITVDTVQRGADEIRDQLSRVIEESDAPGYVKELMLHIVDTVAEALAIPDFDVVEGE